MPRRRRCLALFLLLSTTLSACSTPSQRLNSEAVHAGYTRLMLEGKEFQHVAYFKQGSGVSGVLHVYLEGDGTPWLSEDRIARDPTPRNPLMLRLMTIDPYPSLYLGRPCYNGLADSPECNPFYWTFGRFSPQVVDSMAAALRRFLQSRGRRAVAFFGYSGGGVLAMLLAERFEETESVITIAANLDIDKWCEYNGYTPLVGSLNPATRPLLSSEIRQLHLAGALDQNVPPSLIEPAVARQLNAKFVVVDEFDHRCCWEEIWGSILAAVEG